MSVTVKAGPYTVKITKNTARVVTAQRTAPAPR